jgi:translation initiation factor IF-2
MGVMLLGKIKLYDIAKELNLTSKEVLEVAKKLNIDAKSHLSSIEEDEAKRIRESL